MGQNVLTEKKIGNKILKISTAVILLLWFAGWLFYLWSREEGALTSTLDTKPLQDEIKEVAASLLQLKQNKQQCKDELNEYQTIAEYKGIQFFCNERDAEIEQLKNRLASMLTMSYEQLDYNLNESKQERDMDMLANGTGTALEKLTAFLQAE